jgi:hypothetical protein
MEINGGKLGGEKQFRSHIRNEGQNRNQKK